MVTVLVMQGDGHGESRFLVSRAMLSKVAKCLGLPRAVAITILASLNVTTHAWLQQKVPRTSQNPKSAAMPV